MSNNKHYYDSIRLDGFWIGRIYHYDESGNQEVFVHRTEPQSDRSKAVDLAIEWADDHDIDAEYAD